MTFTQAEAAQIVKDALGINLSDYKQTNMEMFYVNTATGTAAWMTRKNNPLAAEYLTTDLGGSFIDVRTYNDGTVALDWDGGLYSINGAPRRRYKMTTTLKIEEGIVLRRNWSELNDVIISANAVKNTSQIALARTKFKMPNDTVENVIHMMATSSWYYKFAPSIINQLTCEIITVPEVGNRMHVSYKLFKSGVEIQAKKVRWQVFPTDVAFAASAQFPTQNEFYITNDLTNREDFAVMASNSVRITCMPTTTEDDGDLVAIQKEGVYSLGFTPKQYF